jgi:CubicO group peptidase (beta-lactamase class C family)
MAGKLVIFDDEFFQGILPRCTFPGGIAPVLKATQAVNGYHARPEGWESPMHLTRRHILGAGLVTAAAAASRFWVEEANATASTTQYQDIFPELDRFAEQYMRDMNSPGMTLVLADRNGVQRVVTYGFSDLEQQRKVQSDELFQIGSISKSFLAIVLLQLREEGRLDLDRPIFEYLPWFRIDSEYAPITTHHLLTHTSGLPGWSQVFVSDPAQRHLAAYAPGRYFHYNNMAYAALGHLAWTLDGREFPELYRARIFAPLGMSRSEPAIDFDMRERMAKSYAPFLSDRPYPRHARLCEAPSIVTTDGAGCIASTARDMGAYIQMIANRGRGPRGHLLSPESFALFAKRQVAAQPFGPEASYGYGIAVEELDGNTLLRHTGGMVSFMSSMAIDIDAGIGCFASINAQQEYRPTPVVRYAIQLMRARAEQRPLPAAPAADSATSIGNAGDYVGVFAGAHGQLEFASQGNQLFLLYEGKRLVLERLSEADQFHVPLPKFERFPLVFGRKPPVSGNGETAGKLPVVEVSWGDAWYPGAAYVGPRKFDVPAEWGSYVGHYRNENPWIGSIRVVLLKGRLILNSVGTGVTPLEPDGELFRLRDDPANAEWIRFGEIVNGRCMRLKLSGEDLWRVARP